MQALYCQYFVTFSPHCVNDSCYNGNVEYTLYIYFLLSFVLSYFLSFAQAEHLGSLLTSILPVSETHVSQFIFPYSSVYLRGQCNCTLKQIMNVSGAAGSEQLLYGR
jgi:hypothetical protein